MNQNLCPFERKKLLPKNVKFSVIDSFDPADQDTYSKIRNFLLESQAIYPSIDRWWLKRVIPGISSGERFCQVATIDDNIAALSIVKRGKASSKLCTLKVADRYRSSGLGQHLLRSSIKRILSDGCKNIHYSISEPIQEECGEFFTPFGFSLSLWKKGAYVPGVDELIFSADWSVLIHELRSKLETDCGSVLFSIKPDFAKLIEAGFKNVEFRRRFSNNFIPQKALFYVSSPVREIRFIADVRAVVESSPSQLWKNFKNDAGVDYNTFFSYFKGLSEGKAILLSNILALAKPIHLDTLKSKIAFSPPQSYRIIGPKSPLHELIESSEKE